ncbi:MAG: hypothetical protein CVU66_01505 [Deltaproteobacteria bacterium HGW-Deltaproteobacteria-23]|nr:MAG: hypothetical protein CVU66_01505 [Deltaproteobacteria bacterium HGW-Deltaproteobacteria-23]
MNKTRNKENEGTGAEWESKCNQCGFCCFEKIENDNGTIFYTQTPCRYLDVVSRRCKVYARRFRINPECVQLTPELVPQLKWLHPGCGYRGGETPDKHRQDLHSLS